MKDLLWEALQRDIEAQTPTKVTFPELPEMDYRYDNEEEAEDYDSEDEGHEGEEYDEVEEYEGEEYDEVEEEEDNK